MKFLKRLRVTNAVQRLEEEVLYAAVAAELAAGTRREGLWAKALVNASGVEAKAQSLYLKYRVQSMRDEETLAKDSTELLMQAQRESKRAEEFYVPPSAPARTGSAKIATPSSLLDGAQDLKVRTEAATKRLFSKGYSVSSNAKGAWEVWSELYDQRYTVHTLNELEHYANTLY